MIHWQINQLPQAVPRPRASVLGPDGPRTPVGGTVEEEEEEEDLFVFMDTVEGPRAPAAKLTARHSSLTRVRAAPLSPR